MKQILILVLLMISHSGMSAELPISTAGGDGFYYYTIGGGKPVPDAASARQTIRLSGSYGAGLGYSCGAFNPYLNVSQMMNEIEDALRRLPQQFIAGATAYIINLPGYLLNKANPALYNVVMKGFDDSFDLFNMSFKSCEAIQSEVAQGKDPYERWIKLAKSGKWKSEIESNGNDETIDKIEENVNQSVANDGVTTIGGAKEGGLNQPPIRTNRAVTLAGYNLLLARPADTMAPGPLPTNGDDPDPIVRAWPAPQDAVDWLTDIVGEMELDISENGNITAAAGRGLKPKVDELANEIRDAIIEALHNNNYDDLEPYRHVMQIGLPVIQAIQNESRFVKSIQVDRLANELALNYIQDQIGMMKQILRAGMMEPHLVKSESADQIIEQIRNKTLPDLEAAVDEMHKELDLRLKTMSRTALSIVQRYNAPRSDSILQKSQDTQPLGDGAVKQ